MRTLVTIALVFSWGVSLAQTGPVSPPAASYCSAADEVLYCTGAGSLTTLDVGTSAGDLIVLDGSARLPAVDGSQLTNLPGGAGDLLAANNLSDVNNAATSLSNLGGQSQSAALDDFSALGVVSGADQFVVSSGAGAFSYESAADARTSLGLGTSATLDVGTSASNVVQLDGSARLPAVDGSQLTNLPASSDCISPSVTPTYVWNPASFDAAGSFINQGTIATIRVQGGCGFGMWDTNGGTDYATIDSATFGRPASWTGLFAYQSQNNSNSHWVMGSGSSTNPSFLATVRNDGTGKIGVYFGDGTNWALSTTTSTFTEGQWYVIAFRYTSGDSDVDIWINGTQDTTTDTGSGTLPTTSGGTAYDFSIGRQGTYAGDTAEANVGPVYWWSSALTDPQVEAASALLESEFGI